MLGIPSLDLCFFLPFFPFLCFLCLKPGKKKNNKTPKLTPTSQQKAPNPTTCCCSPAEPRMLGVALSPPRALDPSGLFQAVGSAGTPVPGHHETCPSFSPVLEAQGPKEGRQQVKDARAGLSCRVFPLSPGVPGKLCHPWHFLCHWLRCRFPGECLPRVCWNVCPGSCREKQALMALGLLLATLWGGDEECGGIGTCPLHLQVPALASSTFPAPV